MKTWFLKKFIGNTDEIVFFNYNELGKCARDNPSPFSLKGPKRHTCVYYCATPFQHHSKGDYCTTTCFPIEYTHACNMFKWGLLVFFETEFSSVG